MANYTVPNQRVINIHREKVSVDFLGIQNLNWQAAARDLGAHALMLYLYLASNADGYNLALSPSAIRQAIGMPRSTYHDQFTKLVEKGYLVQGSGNSFDFYEKPQPSHANIQTQKPPTELNFEECPRDENVNNCAVQPVSSKDIEINNNEISLNKERTNNNGLILADTVRIPEVKEIRITIPTAEGKKKIPQKPQEEKFIF